MSRLLATLSLMVPASVAVPLVSAESLHFDTDEVHVGQIDPSVIDTLLCTFEFQNLSDSVVWLTRGKVSCECSSMVYPQDTILSQHKGTITTFTATGELEGEFARFFMLYDQHGEEYVLIVSGETIGKE